MLDPFDRHSIRVLPALVPRLVLVGVPLVLVETEERDRVQRGPLVQMRSQRRAVRMDRRGGLGRRPSADRVRGSRRGSHVRRGGDENGHPAGVCTRAWLTEGRVVRHLITSSLPPTESAARGPKPKDSGPHRPQPQTIKHQKMERKSIRIRDGSDGNKLGTTRRKTRPSRRQRAGSPTRPKQRGCLPLWYGQSRRRRQISGLTKGGED